jgi:hypothetical protein
MIEMEDNDVDEKLIKWNDIFEELVIDANSLIDDLWDNLNYIAIVGGLLILLGGANVATALILGRGTRVLAFSFIIFITCAVNGITQLRRWHSMRQKYSRLHSLRKEMGLD